MTKFDPYRKKTFTSYWNHFSTQPKRTQITSLFLKNVKKKLKAFLGYQIKIQSYKKINTNNEFFSSYQKNEHILQYRNKLLCAEVIKYIKDFEINCSKQNIVKYVEQYCKIFSESPIKEMDSGFAFNEGLFLYCLIKIIKPSLVIESGIMRGFTTYLIDAATDKNCLINCYDISFEKLTYKSPKGFYFEHDIHKNPPNFENHKVLAFWDDHTSQLDRLEFSIENKIKFNFFDDDLGFLNFHSDGWPPIPSITMLYELKQNLIKENSVKWVSRNREGEIKLDGIKNNNAIEQVNFHKLFPNLFPITGYKSHSECSFVVLK